jgi:hypothetical protein
VSLTLAQLQALKADILADGTLSQIPANPDGDFAVAAAYNQAAAGPFYVWRTSVPVPDIYDNVTWATFTPNDAIPIDTVLNNAIWQARAFNVQIKQTNLTSLLGSRTTFDASKSSQRTGLQDATLNLPTGTAGANRSAGWAAILLILSRAATRAEKLFANVVGGTGAAQAIGSTGPATMVFEGPIGPADVLNARNS